jgi:hypothetical protein
MPTSTTATPSQTDKPFIPPDPDNIQITDADRRLIHDWFSSNDPITELSHLHQLTIMEIARWASRPEIAKILETLKRLHVERFALKATAAAYDALITLHFISTTEHPTNAQEIARRAATKLITLAFPRNTNLTPNTTTSATSSKPTTPAAATKAEAPAPTPEPATNLRTSTPSMPPAAPCPSVAVQLPTSQQDPNHATSPTPQLPPEMIIPTRDQPLQPRDQPVHRCNQGVLGPHQ